MHVDKKCDDLSASHLAMVVIQWSLFQNRPIFSCLNDKRSDNQGEMSPQKEHRNNQNSTHKYIEIHLLFVNIGVLHYVQNLCCKRRHVEQQIVKTFFTFEVFILTPDKVRI